MAAPASWIETIGYAAAALTTGAFVPQAWLTLRTRDVSGLSFGMYAAFTAGVALWLAYGLLLGAWPVIVANVLTLALALLILGVKWLEERRLRRAARAAASAPGCAVAPAASSPDHQNGL